MGALCIAQAESTTEYKTDGHHLSKSAKDDHKCVDEFCTCFACYVGILLYIAAFITFHFGKFSLKALRFLLPCFNSEIKARAQEFTWMDPRISPTHTTVKIRTVT